MHNIGIIRGKEPYNSFFNYQIVADTGESISIETDKQKTMSFENLPVSIYAKMNWVRSKKVVVDKATHKLHIRGDEFKFRSSRILAPLAVLISAFPRIMFGASRLSNTIMITGFGAILLYAFYLLIIKRNSWIVLENSKMN
jgi:hypothetical protein